MFLSYENILGNLYPFQNEDRCVAILCLRLFIGSQTVVFDPGYGGELALEGMNAPLPPGWQENVDEEGRPYYFEVASRKTQWAHPYDPYFKNLLARARAATSAASRKGFND